MRSTLRAMATLAAAALALGMLATGAAAQSGTVTYTGQLDSFNDSGSSAEVTATLDQSTNELDVTIEGSGFPALPHAQHIHGVQSGQSTCPAISEVDENGDGFASTPEAGTTYGPIQASLTTEGDTSPDSALAVERFPTYESSYTRTFELSEDVASGLERFHVVIHGTDVNGNGEYDMEAAGASPLNEELPFEATMPAACGTLAASASGGIQTGGGGTANNGSAPLALLAMGGVVIAGLGYGARRVTA